MAVPRTEKTNLIRVHKRTNRKRQRGDWRGYPTDGQGPWLPAGGTHTEPNPDINSLQPNTGSAAAGPIKVIVHGFAFTASSVVEIDGVAQTTTFVSPTQLSVNYDPATTGVKNFTVRDGLGESNSLPFTVAAIGEDPEEDPATNPAAFTIEFIKEWVDLNPDWADEVLTKEQARGDEARATLVAWLEGFIEHRDE